MAAWGAYFASYVENNSSKVASQAQEVSDKPSPFLIKPYKAELKNGYPQVSKLSCPGRRKLISKPRTHLGWKDLVQEQRNSIQALQRRRRTPMSHFKDRIPML